MKKKLLFVTNHLQYSDGVAKALLEFANALDPEKFDVTVMSVFRKEKNFCKNFNGNVKIKTMFGFYLRGMWQVIKKISPATLYKLFVRESYDVEIAFQYGAPTAILAHSSNKKAKHIAWMHGYGEAHLKDHERYDNIVCCAKSNSEKYAEVYKYPERITYLYNLVNDSVILQKAEETPDVVKKYGFTFCTVGRLSPEKGFLRLLKCHARLMNEGLRHNLWIVGGGAQYHELKNFIDENGLQDSAVLFGQDNNPYKYMARCDMFVCSSYTEGFSTVCVEAAILGKSIVTTEVGGAVEFVKENGIGSVVPNDDDALYEAMKGILEDRGRIAEFEANISKMRDLHYDDRKRQAEEFFEKL